MPDRSATKSPWSSRPKKPVADRLAIEVLRMSTVSAFAGCAPKKYVGEMASSTMTGRNVRARKDFNDELSEIALKEV